MLMPRLNVNAPVFYPRLFLLGVALTLSLVYFESAFRSSPKIRSFGGPEKGRFYNQNKTSYLDEVYLVTALIPSETACLASSPGSNNRTAV